MIVEGPMLESCLPRVETEGYQASLEDTVLSQDTYWASLKEKIGAYRSLGLRCLTQSSDRLKYKWWQIC